MKKEINTWCVELRNQYMDLNKLSDNNILSSMILLLLFGFKENMIDRVYISRGQWEQIYIYGFVY